MKGLDYCDQCPLRGQKKCGPEHSLNTKLIIVGEGPGNNEVRKGVPFIGMSGRELNRTLQKVGIPRAYCHVTNATLCKPLNKMSASLWKKALTCCRLRLYYEIQETGCKTVLALGNQALRTFTNLSGIENWMGEVFEGVAFDKKTKRQKKERTLGELANFKRYKIIASLHPSGILRKKKVNRPITERHAYRAWALAHGVLPRWDWGEIVIEPSFRMLEAIREIHEDGRNGTVIGFDVETQGDDPITAPVMCVGVAGKHVTVSMPWDEYHSKGNVFVYGCYEGASRLDRALVSSMIALLTDPNVSFVGHNVAYDVMSMRARFGIKIEGKTHDTLLQHVVAFPRMRHALGIVASIYLEGADRWKTRFGSKTDAKGAEVFAQAHELDLRDYNSKDCVAPPKIYAHLNRALDARHNGQELYESLRRQSEIAAEMQLHGWRVDMDRVEEAGVPIMKGVADNWEAFQEIAKGTNPNSTPQLQKLFIDRLSAPVLAVSDKTGEPSLGKEVLAKYLTFQGTKIAECAEALLVYRNWRKLQTTYYDNFKLRVGSNEILHPPWKCWGTRTGRWSAGREGIKSRDVPIQCIPKRGKLPLRHCFVARPGMHLVIADYSRLEMWIIAHVAGDRKLLAAFENNDDAHTLNAQRIFGKKYGLRNGVLNDAVKKHHRNLAKAGFYQTCYMSSRSAEALFAKLSVTAKNITLPAASFFIRQVFKAYPDLDRWQKNTVLKAKQTGYIECPISGRRQYYPDKRIEEDEVLNFAIQGTGADVIDGAIMKLYPMLDRSKGEMIIGQVHDELICEGPDPEALAAKMHRAMMHEVEINGRKARFPVDIEIGRDWTGGQEWAAA